MSKYARLIAFLFVAAVAAYGLYAINQRSIERANKATQTALHREDAAQTRTCERIQLLRDQANGTNILVFQTFRSVARSQRKLLRAKNLTPAQRRSARQALSRAMGVVRTTVVTGPTNCKAAVERPDVYVAPAPEFVYKNSKRVRIAIKRSQDIVRKAETNTPLYTPKDPPGSFPSRPPY